MSGLTAELSLLSNVFNNFNDKNEKCLILIDGIVK